MNYPSPTAAQPAVTVVEISDPTAANAGIELIDQDAVQLQPMPLRARRVIVRLGASTVVFHSVNRRVRTRTSVHEGLLAYVTFGPRSTGSVNGLPVRAGLMLAAESAAEARFVVEANWESITFLLSPDEIRGHLAARQREREFRLPQGVEALQVDAASVARLHAWGRRLVNTAQRQPLLFGERNAEHLTAHVELVEILLATIGAARDLEPSRVDRTRQSQSLIVKRAEDFALAQTQDHLYVSDLCRVTGVSERTLEYAFRDVLGMTPVTYLIRVRLHRVTPGTACGPSGIDHGFSRGAQLGFLAFRRVLAGLQGVLRRTAVRHAATNARSAVETSRIGIAAPTARGRRQFNTCAKAPQRTRLYFTETGARPGGPRACC